MEFVHCKHQIRRQGVLELCNSSFSGEDLAKAFEGYRAHVAQWHPSVIDAHDNADGEPCANAISQCPGCVDSALDADIPLSVILGRTKLTDHFSRDYIAAQAGREAENE